MLVFVGKLLQVQAIDAHAYSAKARENRYLEYTVAAERGEITDRNGIALATSVDAYDITADPKMFTPAESEIPDAPEQAAALLAPILGKDAATLTAQLSKSGSRYTVLARRQTPQVWKQIKDLKAVLAEKASAGGAESNALAGVFQEPTTKRVYPNGDLAAGILGFVSADGKGGGGLESQLNEELSGQDGKIKYAQSGGRRVPTMRRQGDPGGRGHRHRAHHRPGHPVGRPAGHHRPGREVQGGRRLRRRAEHEDGRAAGHGQRTRLRPERPLRGRQRLPGQRGAPGRLRARLHRKGDVDGRRAGGGRRHPGHARHGAQPAAPRDRLFKDDIDHKTWYLTLNGVLAKSSNIGTILATGQLGKTQPEANRVLYSYLRKFGIGSPTGLGYPGESAGLLTKPQDWSTSQQYTIPFGQGLSLNAVQAASVYSTIANGGVRVAPTLVRGTKGADGRYTRAAEPEETRVVSEKTARELSAMLESVVDDEEGTGTKARIPGYRVAGKTGTANRVDPVSGVYDGYTASFAGFAAKPTIRRSPSTVRSRTPPGATTSAARSADRSTRRSWSSR